MADLHVVDAVRRHVKVAVLAVQVLVEVVLAREPHVLPRHDHLADALRQVGVEAEKLLALLVGAADLRSRVGAGGRGGGGGGR